MSNRSYSQLYFHSVWTTYNRDPILLQQWECRLYGHIIHKCKVLSLIPLALGGTDNHVHLLFRGRPESVLSDAVGKVKGASSNFVNHELGGSSHFAWQEGYGIFSVGKRELNGIIRYIQYQKQHHNNRTTIPELERTDPEEKCMMVQCPECVFCEGVVAT